MKEPKKVYTHHSNKKGRERKLLKHKIDPALDYGVCSPSYANRRIYPITESCLIGTPCENHGNRCLRCKRSTLESGKELIPLVVMSGAAPSGLDREIHK